MKQIIISIIILFTAADWIQDHPEFGMALDMITPGQLAWWLVKTGIYEEEKSPLLIKK